jgi:acyl carrier protein
MITEKVQQFFIDNFMLDPALELSEADSFLEAGIIDSTGILELIAFLEKSFGITIGDHEIIPDNLDSFKSIKKFVNSKLLAQ